MTHKINISSGILNNIKLVYKNEEEFIVSINDNPVSIPLLVAFSISSAIAQMISVESDTRSLNINIEFRNEENIQKLISILSSQMPTSDVSIINKKDAMDFAEFGYYFGNDGFIEPLRNFVNDEDPTQINADNIIERIEEKDLLSRIDPTEYDTTNEFEYIKSNFSVVSEKQSFIEWCKDESNSSRVEEIIRSENLHVSNEDDLLSFVIKLNNDLGYTHLFRYIHLEFCSVDKCKEFFDYINHDEIFQSSLFRDSILKCLQNRLLYDQSSTVPPESLKQRYNSEFSEEIFNKSAWYLKEENKKLKSEVEKLNEGNKEKGEEKEGLKTRISKQNSEIQRLSEENKRINATIVNNDSEIERLNLSLRSNDNEITRLNLSSQSKDNEIEDLKKQITNLNRSKAEASERLNLSSQSKDNEIEDLKKQITNLNKNKAEVSEKLNLSSQSKDSEIEDLKKQITSLNKNKAEESERLNAEIAKLNEQITNLNKNKAEVSERLNLSSQSKDNEIEDLKKQITNLNSTIANKDSEIAKLGKEGDSENNEIVERKLTRLKNKIKDQETKIGDLEKTNIENKREIQELKSAKMDRENEIKVLNSKHLREITEIKETKTANTTTVKSNSDKLREKENEITRLKETVTEKGSEISRLNRTIANKDNEITRLKRENESLKSSKDKNSERNQLSPEEKKKHLNSEIEKKQDQLNLLIQERAKHKKGDQTYETLKKRINSILAELRELDKEM